MKIHGYIKAAVGIMFLCVKWLYVPITITVIEGGEQNKQEVI